MYTARSPSKNASGTVLMMSLGPAACIHLSARTMALASACVVRGFLSMKLCGAYRQAAGIGPPNTLSASATMRVSDTIFRSPERCSSVITGSRLLMASIWPLRMAATAPCVAPTPMMLTSEGFRPALASTKFVITLVLLPGAVTPIFLPFRSATDLKWGMVLGLTPSTICGARPCSTKARSFWPLTCMLMVCSNAPETTSALPPTTARKACEPPAKSTMDTSSPSALK